MQSLRGIFDTKGIMMDSQTIQMLTEVHALLELMYEENFLVVGHFTIYASSEGPYNPYIGLYDEKPWFNRRDGRVYIYDSDDEGKLRLGREFRLLPKDFQGQVLKLLEGKKKLYDKDVAAMLPPRGGEDKDRCKKDGTLYDCKPFKILRRKDTRTIKGEEKEVWSIHRCFPVNNSQPTFEKPPTQPEPTKVTPPQQPQQPQQPQPVQPKADPQRDGLVAELWNLVPGVYRQWKPEIERLALLASYGSTSEVKDLSVNELRYVLTIVRVDEIGKELYADTWPGVRAHNLNRLTGGEREPEEEDFGKLLNGLRILKERRSEAVPVPK